VSDCLSCAFTVAFLLLLLLQLLLQTSVKQQLVVLTYQSKLHPDVGYILSCKQWQLHVANTTRSTSCSSNKGNMFSTYVHRPIRGSSTGSSWHRFLVQMISGQICGLKAQQH
jgi:hypothetical protein